MNKILCGDSATVLKDIPDGIVKCFVTSPPYYNVRDYETDGQIGRESNVGIYIHNLLKVFEELYRVLDDNGTGWIVIGDKYEKGQLLGIPWRLALGLQELGWIIRNESIYHKKTPKPESARNRLSRIYETVFLVSKKPSGYYFDLESIKIPAKSSVNKEFSFVGERELHLGRSLTEEERQRNIRRVSPTKNPGNIFSPRPVRLPFKHFAMFPPTLIEPMIIASSRKGDIVCDPFMGAGTVALVASSLGRQYLGIDINFQYCKLAELRLQYKNDKLLIQEQGEKWLRW